MMKKLLIAGALVVSTFGAAATEITAGGIAWDDSVENPGGFGAQANFQQWFTGSATTTDDNGTAGDLTDDYQRITTDAAELGTIGSQLVGLGEFYSFPDGRDNANAPAFCVTLGCELTFAFGGIYLDSFSGSTPVFNIDDAWFNVYIGQSGVPDTTDFDGDGDTDTTLGLSAHAKYAEAQNGTLWAAFDFSFFTFTGTIIGGAGQGTLEIRENLGLADVVTALNYNSVLGDIAFTTDAVFASPTALYSNSSNGNFINNAVPEPASIAMLGLGLLGLAASRRRKV